MTTDNELSTLARTAPDRIWLQVGDDAGREEAFPGDDVDVTWCRDHVFDSDVEYVRADRAQWPPPRPMSEAPKQVDAWPPEKILAWWPGSKEWVATWWWTARSMWIHALSETDEQQPTHWLPLPAAPAEQEVTK